MIIFHLELSALVANQPSNNLLYNNSAKSGDQRLFQSTIFTKLVNGKFAHQFLYNNLFY